MLYYVEFAAKLRQLRIDKNLTQEQLGELVGVTKSVISRYEAAEAYPQCFTIVKIAELFKVSTDYLLGLKRNNTIDVSNLTATQIEAVIRIVEEFEKQNN